MRRRDAKPTDALPEHIVTSTALLEECLEHLRDAELLAFDTEFVGEETYRPDLCLVQVATPERLYLIDPFSAGPMTAFWELVADPNRTVIVHAGREEIRMCVAGVGRAPERVVDIQIAAALLGHNYPVGYAPLVQSVLRVHTRKGETLTDWRKRPLSAGQVRYAFDDVRHLIPVWQRLEAQLQQRGRLSWLEQECDTAIRRAVGADPTVERWRKLKGIGGLDRKGLAVVRALHTWRDQNASRLNRPARALLRDDLLVEIAKRQPTTPEAVGMLRGVPGREHAPLAELVRKTLALPPSEWPQTDEKEIDTPQTVLLANLLNVVLTDLCARMELSAALAASNSELRALVRARQGSRAQTQGLNLTEGWRREVILPTLQAFLDGQHVLQVVDAAATHPIRVVPISDKDSENPS